MIITSIYLFVLCCFCHWSCQNYDMICMNHLHILINCLILMNSQFFLYHIISCPFVVPFYQIFFITILINIHIPNLITVINHLILLFLHRHIINLSFFLILIYYTILYIDEYILNKYVIIM